MTELRKHRMPSALSFGWSDRGYNEFIHRNRALYVSLN